MKHLTRLFLALFLLASAPFVWAINQVVTDCSTEAQLQQKILDVQGTGGGTVTFTCGPGTKIDVTTQLPSITGNVTIDGGNNIELDGHYTARIIQVVGTLTLRNITISRGSSNSSTPGFQDGGAIRNLGTLNTSHARFIDNHTPSLGGSAIYSSGPLNLADSEFASNQGGSAVKVSSLSATAAITRCNFHRNTSFDPNNSTFGGAIQVVDGPSVTITNSSFSENSASYGAGIYVTAQSSLYLGNCAFAFNAAYGKAGAPGLGGGVYNRGQATLVGCTFSNNLARGGYGGAFPPFGLPGGPGQGGAFYNMGAAIVSNCTLAGNQAAGGGAGDGTAGEGAAGGDALGGAIYNADDLTVFSCTVSSNTAVGGGGGKGFLSHGPPGNAEGGGIFEDETGGTTLQNDLIVGNASSALGHDLFGPFSSQGFNLIAIGDASTGLINGVNHDRVGSIMAPIDARLGPLQDNGGATKTMALLSGSPAINAGSGAPSRDQRGYVRNGLPDIGAFESGGAIPHALGNISTRALVQTDDKVMIVGIVVTGGGNKQVLLRALGPTLRNFGIANALANPILELHTRNAQNQDVVVATNDNWQQASNASSLPANLRPPDSLEAAVLVSLAPGNYTAIVRGAAGSSGVALVEGYDLDPTAGSLFSNISTRSFVQTGPGVMIGGFVVKGPDSQKVLIRALGPTLTQFGVSNALANPVLSLHTRNAQNQDVVVATNDNWKATQQAEIQATGNAPPNDLESAIVRTLAPGNYTAILTGVNNTTGNALLEVYALE